jgi:uncharacterized lipoprotein YmbA
MKSLSLGLCALLLLAACMTGRPDRFYVLNPQPAAIGEPRSQFDRQVILSVTIPSLLDRGEMVITTSSGVAVMDHERWGAPLADLISASLSQDIERRRGDVVVLPKIANKAGIPIVRVAVEIDSVTARLGDHLNIETHWRVTDAGTGKETVGRDAFASQRQTQSYAEVAAALSECVAQLADRLAGVIP